MFGSAKIYLVTVTIFFTIDMIWLGIMAPRFYKPTLGDIAISGVNLAPAVLFYAIYPIGLTIFAINPALRSGSALTALIYGALFGFFTYATYDLSNHATLRNWSISLTTIDVTWGTFLGALTSAATFWAVSRLIPTG
jgi:uncharacterized membrane protein